MSEAIVRKIVEGDTYNVTVEYIFKHNTVDYNKYVSHRLPKKIYSKKYLEKLIGRMVPQLKIAIDKVIDGPPEPPEKPTTVLSKYTISDTTGKVTKKTEVVVDE